MISKLTNEGFPMQSSLERNLNLADFVLNCSICKIPTVAIKKENRGVTISSPLRRFYIKNSKAYLFLQKNNLKGLDEFLSKEHYDGLDFYCQDCNLIYCINHSLVWPVFEDDGWYDYTLMRCPKGHERIVDD